jgi:hypothetical protein
MGLLHLRSTNINQAPMPAVLQVKNFGAEKLLCPRQQLFAMSHSFMTVTRSSTIGFSGTVTGLSAHFTAGSSQLMHWRSVRPEMVITGSIRFPHFEQRIVRSIGTSI